MADQALAICRTYDELHAIFRRRADQLRVTRKNLDEISGLPDGLSSKVLAPEFSKRLGPITLPLMLGALGLALAVVEDPEALARARRQITPRREEHVRGHSTGPYLRRAYAARKQTT